MTQPTATMMPPNPTMSFGPRLTPSISTIQPSIGVSHVSSAMKTAKATWIEAIDQPCALLIGLTNKVHPYCRFAIITMQMTQKISWAQRVFSSTRGVATEPVAAIAILSLPRVFGLFRLDYALFDVIFLQSRLVRIRGRR